MPCPYASATAANRRWPVFASAPGVRGHGRAKARPYGVGDNSGVVGAALGRPVPRDIPGASSPLLSCRSAC